MAVILVLFCIFFKVFNLKPYKEIDIGKTVDVKAKLIKIEEKNNSNYFFVDADYFGKAIILVSKKDNLKIGQMFIAKCKNVGFSKARNFGNFDEENYYNSLGYGYKFKATNIKECSKEYNYIKQTFFDIKKKIIKIFDETLESDKSGIFSAIVAGDKSKIEDDTMNLYRKNGIAHILAISGLHISLIGISIFSLLNKKFSLITSCIISTIFMVCFCIMSGESVSAIRATIMFAMRMVAVIFGKPFDMLSSLSFSAIIILITNPLYLYNSSFLLSFIAIVAIALLGLSVQKYLKLNREKNKFIISIISSASVFILTLPIIANSYYEISLYAVLLNLIVIPLMSFILSSAIFSAMLGAISIAISRFAIGIGAFLLDAINMLCVITDKFPYSVIVTGNLSWPKIILFYCVIALFLLYINTKTKIKKDGKIKKILICVATYIILLLIVFIKIPDNKLNITFFDVDQGDGILINTPHNTNILIDGGSTSVTKVKEYRLEGAIKYKKISKIDYAIVTHPDYDHISGLLELINDNSAGAIKICAVYVPKIKENENYEILKNACKENNISFNNICTGDCITEDGLKIRCLHPNKMYSNKTSLNAYSTVLDLEYNDFSALFVGDLEDDGEKILLNEGNLHKFNLLKVSHHGSRFSSSKEFLDMVSPKMAIISAGVNNSYGHPHKETLERLSNVGAKVYLTAVTGQIDLSVDNEGNVAVKTKL